MRATFILDLDFFPPDVHMQEQEDNVKMNLTDKRCMDMDCIYWAQNMVQWQAIVDMLMNLSNSQ